MTGAAHTLRSEPPARPSTGEVDLGAIGRALWARKFLIIVPTLLVAVLAGYLATNITPMFRSEALVIVESDQNPYTRPAGSDRMPELAADELAVQSQVQILMSRDLGRSVVEQLGLANVPEFGQPKGASLLSRALGAVGLGGGSSEISAEERALRSYFEHLTVYAVPNSRVITTQITSEDPVLAARIANAVVESYLALQQDAKQTATQQASEWLASQITELSRRVAEAEAKVEAFRSKSNLFIGANNSTLSNQQLNDLSSELSRAVSQQTEAQTKADAIRQALAAGRPVESLDVANSELIRRLSEQRVALAASVARDSRTFLPAHPRMRELNAQLASVDSQIRQEAAKIARIYENEAEIAQSRVANIRATLDAQKQVAGTANEQEVQLRALEREARAQRELLEQFMTRYRDAAARQQMESIPPDARIISRAAPATEPYSPKPVAVVALSSIAAFVLLLVGFAVAQFMAATPRPLAGTPEAPAPVGGGRGADKSFEKDVAAGVASPALPLSGPTAVSGTRDMEMEAADMRMLGELAGHLAATPKGEGALNILTIAAGPEIDTGGIALSLARSLSERGRKPIVVDAGGESARFTEALSKTGAAGLGELAAGDTTFADAIQRDRASPAHVIGRGKTNPLIGEPLKRLGMVFDALGLTYDFVIVLAPSAERREEMKALAKHTGAAILVSRGTSDAVTTAAHDDLLAAGINDVVVLVAGDKAEDLKQQTAG